MTDKDPSKKFLGSFLPSASGESVGMKPVTTALLQRLSILPKEEIGTFNLVVSSNRMATNEGTKCELLEIGRGKSVIVVTETGEKSTIDNVNIAGNFLMEISESRLIAINKLIDQKIEQDNANLLLLTKCFLDTEPIVVGDIVTWKDGLKISSYPLENANGVVIERLDPPVVFRQVVGDIGSSLTGARFDIVVASITDKGKLVHFLEDSRRFKKVGKLN